MFAIVSRGHKYVVKAETAGWDFDKTDLTTDNTLRELDLSAFIPVNAVLVHCWINYKSTTANTLLRFDRKDPLNDNLRCLMYNAAANSYQANECFLPVDADRRISYKIDDVTWTVINIKIVGWIQR